MSTPAAIATSRSAGVIRGASSRVSRRWPAQYRTQPILRQGASAERREIGTERFADLTAREDQANCPMARSDYLRGLGIVEHRDVAGADTALAAVIEPGALAIHHEIDADVVDVVGGAAPRGSLGQDRVRAMLDQLDAEADHAAQPRLEGALLVQGLQRHHPLQDSVAPEGQTLLGRNAGRGEFDDASRHSGWRRRNLRRLINPGARHPRHTAYHQPMDAILY